MYTHMHISMFIYTYIYIQHAYMYIKLTYVYIYKCMHVSNFLEVVSGILLRNRQYVCVHVYMYVFICIHEQGLYETHIYVHIYI